MEGLEQRRRGSLWRWVGLCCFFCWVTPVQASWERHQQAGEAAVRRGRQAEARRHFLAAVREARRSGLQDPRLDISLNNLARLGSGPSHQPRKSARVHRRSARRHQGRRAAVVRRGRQRHDARTVLHRHRLRRYRQTLERVRAPERRRLKRRSLAVHARPSPRRQVRRQRLRTEWLARRTPATTRLQSRRTLVPNRLRRRRSEVIRRRAPGRRVWHASRSPAALRASKRHHGLRRQRLRLLRPGRRVSPRLRRARVERQRPVVRRQRARLQSRTRRDRRLRRAWVPPSPVLVVRFPTAAGVLLCALERVSAEGSAGRSYEVRSHTLLPVAVA